MGGGIQLRIVNTALAGFYIPAENYPPEGGLQTPRSICLEYRL